MLISSTRLLLRDAPIHGWANQRRASFFPRFSAHMTLPKVACRFPTSVPSIVRRGEAFGLKKLVSEVFHWCSVGEWGSGMIVNCFYCF